MSNISTFIIDQDPKKFGGKQSDYERQVEEIVLDSANKFSLAIASGQDLLNLFHDTLNNSFSPARQKIAQEHKTDNANLFGKRRDKLISLTPLEGIYQEGKNLLKPILKNYIEKLINDHKTEITISGEECFGKKFSTDLAIYNCNNYHDLEFDIKTYEVYKKICNLCSITPKSKPFELKYWDEIVQNKYAMQKLKQVSIVDYKRFRNTIAFNQMKKDARVENNQAVLHATDWVLVTARFEIEPKRQYALSQYLMSLNRLSGGRSSVEQMMQHSKIYIIHQDAFLIEPMLNAIAKIFKDALNWDKQNQQQLISTMAFFRAHFAHAMPWCRGSNAACEWFELSIFRCHGFYLSYKKGQSVDLAALTLPMAEFVAKYPSMITLKPIVD